MDIDHFYIPESVAQEMLYEAIYRNKIKNSTYRDLSPIRKRISPDNCRKREINILPCERFKGNKENYSVIADKNALLLIKQEEIAKMKAEKKKLKKERQKEKNKSVNINNIENKRSDNDNAINKICSVTEKLTVSPESKNDAEGLDVKAAFMSRAIKKVKNTPILKMEAEPQKGLKKIDSIIKTALNYEKDDHYKEAVHFLSQAINLAPKRSDLYLKRSFLYYKLAKFVKSIRDAQKALEFYPNNADALYRLAEGHFAVKNLAEADASFEKLLKLHPDWEEAKERLLLVRQKQLEQMGFNPNEAFAALFKSKNKTLDEAIEFLTAVKAGTENVENFIYYSDEEEDEEEEEEEDEEGESSEEEEGASKGATGPAVSTYAPHSKPIIKIDKKSPLLTDPSNPFECSSLFVGNLKKDITSKEMKDIFIRFGDVKKIKLTTEPTCFGFVNYERSESAGEAMKALQGSKWLLSVTPLLLKYPVNVVNNTLANMQNPQLFLDRVKAAKEAESKTFTFERPWLLSPVEHLVPVRFSDIKRLPKTEECYFWRTDGCMLGSVCFNLHIPEHHHIDLKKGITTLESVINKT